MSSATPSTISTAFWSSQRVIVTGEMVSTGEVRWDTTKPNGQPRRKLDVSRAKERFGFEARPLPRRADTHD